MAKSKFYTEVFFPQKWKELRIQAATDGTENGYKYGLKTRVWWLDSGTKSSTVESETAVFYFWINFIARNTFRWWATEKNPTKSAVGTKKTGARCQSWALPNNGLSSCAAWLKIHWFCWTKKTAADVGVFASQIGSQIPLSVIVVVKHDMTKKSLGTHLTRNSFILFLKHHGNQWKKVIEFIDVLYATTLGSL